MTSAERLERGQKNAAAVDAAVSGFPSADALLAHLIAGCSMLPAPKSQPSLDQLMGLSHTALGMAQQQNALNLANLMAMMGGAGLGASHPQDLANRWPYR